jgi:hypothetical protein
MPQRDQATILHFVPLIAPVAARTDDTAIVSAIIDTKGYNACTLVIVTGTNTDADATFSVLVEDGNDAALADNAAVADENLVGTEALAGFTFADDVECRKIGYVGYKRYVRATVTPSGNGAGNIFLAGVAVLGEPASAPTPNPPQ